MSSFNNNNEIRINIIGDIYCDFVASNLKSLPTWGGDVLSSGISILPGGSCLNTTLHMANYIKWYKNESKIINNNNELSNEIILGIYSAIGNDFQGQICLNKLKEIDIINCDNLLKIPNSRTGSCIVLSGDSSIGDRCFVSDRGCMDNISFKWFNEASLLDATHIHIAGYYNCKSFRIEILEFLYKAKEKNVSISLNPQYDDKEIWDGIEELCPYINVLTCNENECLSISKAVDIHTGAIQLLAWGCSIVIVTVGAKGCISYYKDANSNSGYICVDHDAPIVQVLDTTGAGDAFVGAFIAQWIIGERSNEGISNALKAGILSGSAAITVTGGSTYSLESLTYLNNIILDNIL